MTTLHLLDNSDNLEICLTAYQPDDTIVLIGKAVLMYNDSKLMNLNYRCLVADLAARGLTEQVAANHKITSDQVADLCVSCSRQIAW